MLNCNECLTDKDDNCYTIQKIKLKNGIKEYRRVVCIECINMQRKNKRFVKKIQNDIELYKKIRNMTTDEYNAFVKN